MTDKISFKVRTHTVEYGDKRRFVEHTIVFLHRGRTVGLEHGPRRATVSRPETMKAARARIAVLKTRRLFAIRITRKHISDGKARSCFSCAIAQALWHNQDRMGFPKSHYNFEVSPYAAFANARGIVREPTWRSGDDEKVVHIPADELPTLVFSGRDYRGRDDRHGESMLEWAMRFDDWAESRFMSLSAWREEHSAEPDERPWRPGRAAFVLDLDMFKEGAER